MKSHVAAVVLLLVPCVRADDWPPPNPAELAMQAPQIEPQADAEALLWEVYVTHELNESMARTLMSHYLRIKVFSEAGRDRLGTVEIPYGRYHSISDISGRTIRPDGSAVELKKESVYDSTVAKAGGTELKAKSFALPGLEVGSIIEYRWKETIEYAVARYFRLEFQREIPIHLVRYHIKPITDPGFPYGMGVLDMNLKSTPMAKEKGGYFMTSAARIPAFREEPDMPPEAGVKPWLLVYYSDSSEPPDKYWPALGKRVFEGYEGSIKLNAEMRKAAQEAVKGAADDEARLRTLFDFVRSTIANTSYDLAEGAPSGPTKDVDNSTTADTWKRRTGSAYEINLLFIALAESLGYEARLARVSSREFGGFPRNFPDTYFLRNYNVAVKLKGAWTFCDPGYPYLPFGMLHWNEQGQAALIAHPKLPELVVTPVAAPDASETRREGKLKLAPDGALEGELRLAYSGHAATSRRSRYRSQAAAQREEAARDSVKRAVGAGEVTDVVLDGLAGSGPLTIACRVKIPGYAQRTGQRMFLQSALFNRNASTRYSASERRYPVMFVNAWAEHDTLSYELPQGYALESPEAPGSMSVKDVGEYTTRMSVSADGRTLHYERRFDFGRGGHLMFPAGAYPSLKQVFDRLRELDGHSLSLKQASR